MNKMTRFFGVVTRYTPRFFIKSVFIYALCPIIAKSMPLYVYLYRAAVLAKLKLMAKKNMRGLQAQKDQILESGSNGCIITLNELGLCPDDVALIEKQHRDSMEVIIADIDQSGLWVSHFGTIADVPQIERSEFIERTRFKIQVVSLDKKICIKKNYKDSVLAFVNELRALYALAKVGANVPAVMAINFDELTITMSYIKGDQLDDLIAKKEAEIGSDQTENKGNLITMVSGQKRMRNIPKGTYPIGNFLTKVQVDELSEQLHKIHDRRIVLKDIKYGNVIIEQNTGKPFWIDFDYSRYYPNASKATFAFLRNRDLERFNLMFSTDCVTYNKIKSKITEKESAFIKGWYAPMYFGLDLKIGNLFDCNVGFGRWNYLLSKHLPSLSGKRVLDLGANNAFNSLQMLRAGASQAIAVELETHNIERGMFAKAAFEWFDSKYYDLKYIHANMKDVPSMDLGKFDVVIALCSLYYLNDDQIAEVVRHVSTLTDLFLVQCNISPTVARGDDYIRTKSSVQYALDILEVNGFNSTKVVAPKGYTRPLIIAQKAC